MDERLRWPLANLCYAAISGIVGLVLVLMSHANEDLAVLSPIGGIALIVAFLYLVTGLYRMAQVLTDQEVDQ